MDIYAARPELEALLARHAPAEELAWRMAIAQLHPACRGGSWARRRDQLLQDLALDASAFARLMTRVDVIAATIAPASKAGAARRPRTRRVTLR